MRILVLDDEDIRHEQFAANLTGHSVVHVRTAEEAGHALAQEKFDLVYLDHDLNDFARNPGGYGQVEQTGFDVARFIARYLAPQKHPEKVVVHSWNPAGARRMVAELQEAGIPVTYEPFGVESGSRQTQTTPAGPWVTVGTLEPEKLAELKEMLDDQEKRMRTPEARAAARSLFTDDFPPERPSKCMDESKEWRKKRRAEIVAEPDVCDFDIDVEEDP